MSLPQAPQTIVSSVKAKSPAKNRQEPSFRENTASVPAQSSSLQAFDMFTLFTASIILKDTVFIR